MTTGLNSTAAALLVTTLVLLPIAGSAEPEMLEQGEGWTKANRQSFYAMDQGSRIMPLSWMKSLKQPDGSAFMADSLSRYGYLPNPNSPTPGLPVGFTTNVGEQTAVGMTCAACHTRQIDVDGQEYRIDGGPAIVDFQSFMKDLDTAVGAVLETDDAFSTFASEVLGDGASDKAKTELKAAVDLWFKRYHTLVERALPDPAWGPSRLDAISMIFNRVSGLDIGQPPDYLIPDNIKVADAPSRYPFLWNAWRQDKTQWPGFADNGDDVLGLARNLGEVYGVFGEFHPTERSGSLFELNRDYLANNSANFSGLWKLEDLMAKIGPPKWRFELDDDLAKKGKAVFDRKTADGGCVECHGIRKGAFRSLLHETWATPVMDVGTDTRECSILGGQVDTGVLSGAKIEFLDIELSETETAFKVLAVSVLGSIIQRATHLGHEREAEAAVSATDSSEAKPATLPPALHSLRGAFRDPATMLLAANPSESESSRTPRCAYESRVLQGIWAAAPYMHNGSVPTLEDLLKTAEQRPKSFAIGPAYDVKSVGMAKEQTAFDYVLQATGCDDVDSGNSNCGHEFGTDLPAEDKTALLEYLKSI